MPGSDLVAHALLDFGTGMLTLSDPMESYGLIAGDPARGTTFSLALYVPNVDEVTATAEARGATVREPAGLNRSPARLGYSRHDPRR
jgi:PhnB protein